MNATNDRVVTDAERAVKAVHPSALVCYNPDGTGFKVYKDRDTWVALSASFCTVAEAWDDAAKRIEERRCQTSSSS